MPVNRLGLLLESPPLLQQLSAPSGANSFEQVKIRMAQEAVLSRNQVIDLKHLIGALIGNPNGRVRFCFNTAMQTADVRENEIREKLHVRKYNCNVVIPRLILQSEEVESTFLLALFISKQREKTRPDTEDILSAIIVRLTNNTSWKGRELADQANFLIDYIVNSDSLDAIF